MSRVLRRLVVALAVVVPVEYAVLMAVAPWRVAEAVVFGAVLAGPVVPWW